MPFRKRQCSTSSRRGMSTGQPHAKHCAVKAVKNDPLEISFRQWQNALALVGLLAMLLHFDAINNGMVFDDHLAVQQNNVIKDGFDIVQISTSRFWGDTEYFNISAWRPFTTLTFSLNHAVHGMSAAGYHLINLLLHGLTAVLVALLARRLGASALSALFAALLFSVHPIHVEAVVPVVGRADLLLGAFGLGALLLWEARRTVLALTCLTCALLSKEMGVVAAAMLVWREATRNGFSKKPEGLRWIWPIVLTGLYVAARFAVVGEIDKGAAGALENPMANTDFLTRLWTSGTIHLKLLGLMVYPRVLLREYSYAIIVPQTGPSASAIVGLTLLLASIAGTVLLAKKHSGMSLALGLWTGGFLLVSNLAFTTPMIFAERVFYFPSAGLLIFLFLAAETFIRQRVILKAVWCLSLAAAAALGTRSVMRVSDWKTDSALAQASLRDGPNCIKTIAEAATSLWPNGLLTDEETLGLLQSAIRLKENHPLPHLALAKFYVVQDREKEALAQLDRAERLSPEYPELNSVQCAYASKYALHVAIETCERAVKRQPNNPSNWSFLGISLDRLNKPVEANRAFRTALDKMKGPRADILFNYGVFLAGRGRLQPARQMFLAVRQVNPKDPDAEGYLLEVEHLLSNPPSH